MTRNFPFAGMETLIKKGKNCYEKVLNLSKADLFQVVIHEVHNQLFKEIPDVPQDPKEFLEQTG